MLIVLSSAMLAAGLQASPARAAASDQAGLVEKETSTPRPERTPMPTPAPTPMPTPAAIPYDVNGDAW